MEQHDTPADVVFEDWLNGNRADAARSFLLLDPASMALVISKISQVEGELASTSIATLFDRAIAEFISGLRLDDVLAYVADTEANAAPEIRRPGPRLLHLANAATLLLREVRRAR